MKFIKYVVIELSAESESIKSHIVEVVLVEISTKEPTLNTPF